MNRITTKRFVRGFFQVGLILMVAGIATMKAQAQCPSPVSLNPAMRVMGQQIAILRAAGATVTCSNMNTSNGEITIQYPSGMYFDIRMSADGSQNTTMWDPTTGRLTTFYFQYDSGFFCLIIDDSVHGLINASDGWYSIWDPLGNPFSAAIQDPLNAMTLWTSVIQNPAAAGDYRVPPAPIQVQEGIY